MFLFWATVRGGWRGGLGAFSAYAVLTILLVSSYNIAPWLTPFVIIPACVIPVVLIGKRELRRERDADARKRDGHPV